MLSNVELANDTAKSGFCSICFNAFSKELNAVL
jgi:hypothetical protein